MLIPKNRPAIVKYLPAILPDTNQEDFFEACVRQGMQNGKTRTEAERTEIQCINLMKDLLRPDSPKREIIFTLQTAYAESAKSRHLWKQYCTGNGCEIASGGRPMMPHAIQIELSKEAYAKYNSGNTPELPIQYHRDGIDLPFKEETMDWVGASHFLEDVPRDAWPVVMLEWKRVLKPGGYMIILVPEVERWNYAINILKQPPNCCHSKPEPSLGDMSKTAVLIGLEVVQERLTESYPNDYTIMGVFRKR